MSLSGSVKNGNTVSGDAAMRTSRVTCRPCVVVTPSGPFPTSLSPLVPLGCRLEPLEAFVPEVLQELLQIPDRLRPGHVVPPRAVPSLGHESRLPQYPQVLRYGGPGPPQPS